MDEQQQFGRLLEQVRDGSSEAATELVETYGPHIRAVVRRSLPHKLRPMHDSMDFVQAVWMSVIRSPEKFSELDTSQQFVAYLARMARNKVIDEYRCRTKTLKNDIDRNLSLNYEQVEAKADMPFRRETPSAFAIASEQWELMMAGESPTHRRVIELRRDGVSFRQIAERLLVDERTARRVIQTAARKISS